MTISHSKLANNQKKILLKKFPGLKRHFCDLEKELETNPDDGAKEIILSKNGRGIPVRIMSAETEIFSGVASYSKVLIAVYVCSDDFSLGRIIQYLF